MKIIAACLFAIAVASSTPAFALDPPAAPPGLYRQLESGHSRMAAAVNGKIDDVDYGAGTIVVRSGNRDQTIAIVPSTAIYVDERYATMSDLRRGQTVDVTVLQVGGRLVAQTLRANH